MRASPHRTKAEGASASAETGRTPSPAAIQARVDGVDWTKIHADLDAQGWAVVPKLLTDAEADSHRGPLPSGARLPQPYHHGSARLRSGRVQVFQLSAATPDPGAADGRLSPSRADRQSMARAHGQGGALSAMTTPRSSSAATRRVRPARRRCSSNTRRRTITAFIATSMGSMSSRYRSRSCWISRARTSWAASS